MSKKPESKQAESKHAGQGYGACGVTHEDCPSTWKGSCDLSAPHDGSHHCSACGSAF